MRIFDEQFLYFLQIFTVGSLEHINDDLSFVQEMAGRRTAAKLLF